MMRTLLRGALIALTFIAADAAGLFGTTQEAAGQGYVYQTGNPDLFYNYYVPSGAGVGHPAQMYISPRPVPEMVGHTYITYQPLMPHEYMYRHHRTYRTYHPTGGFTTTRVRWW